MLIKNLHLLNGVLSQEDLDMMEHAALQHKRYNNTSFKIISVGPKKLVMQVNQGKNSAGAYHDAKRLIEIVHETFDRFFPGKTMNIGPHPYQVPGPAAVTDEWIVSKMKETGIRLKQIADESGIDYTQLAALVKGNRPLSQPMKALFWFYFLAKNSNSK